MTSPRPAIPEEGEKDHHPAAAEGLTSAAGSRPTTRGPRRLARSFYYIHRWLGVGATALLVIIGITGVLLNHKKDLGLMPDVVHHPSGSFPDALSLAELKASAVRAAGQDVASAGVGRMDVRPSDGFVKVRFNDSDVTEVIIDLYSGRVLNIDERHDVFLERLHSGEIFGDLWVLMSDSGAILLLILLATGYWLWLYPKSRV